MSEGRERVGYLRVCGKNYPVFKGLNIIGRNKLASVIMKSPTISHQHSMIIVVEKGKYFLSDLNSANGTFLNDEKLTPLLLYEIPNMCKIKFARISAIFLECSGRVASPTFRREQLSEATQNTESFLMAATQKLDVIEEVSIHDLPTQPMDDLITHTMIVTEKTNKSQHSNEIHDLPTQLLCPDVAMEVSVHNVQTQVNNSPTNQTNLEEDIENTISDECIDDSVLPTTSFQDTPDLNKSNKQVGDDTFSKIKNTSSQTTSYHSDSKKRLNKSNSTTTDEFESNKIISTNMSKSQKTEHSEKGSQTPNASQDNSSQSQIHVSQIKRKVRKRISSDSDTPSSLDVLSNPPSPVPPLITKKRNHLSSDESGGDSGTGVVLPNKMGHRKKIPKRRISSENSSSDTDIERISPGRILPKKIKNRSISRKLESNSDTDIEKEPSSRHKATLNKQHEISNNKATVDQSQNTMDTQNSFKLALSNTMDALNTDSESDYVFGNPTQNVSGSQTDSSKPMRTNEENPSDTETLEDDVFMQSAQKYGLQKSTQNETVQATKEDEKQTKVKDDSDSETDDDLLVQKSQQTGCSKTMKTSNSQCQTSNEPSEKENVKIPIHEENNISPLNNFNIAKEIQKLKGMDNIFLASIRDLKNAEIAFKSQSQLQSVKNAKTTQAEIPELCDEDDIFLQPTQKFTASASVTTDKFGIKKSSQDEDDIYLEPTQKFIIPSKNQPCKIELTQNESDDIYLQPTQKFATSCIPTTDKSCNIKESQNEDDDLFLQPTQKLQNKESSQDEEDEDVYLQPTQKFSLPLPAIIEAGDGNELSQNEDDLQSTQKFVAPRKSKLGYLECSENDNGDNDVCLQATQKFSVPLQSSENDPKKCIDNSKTSLPSVESQLEVMFSSQNISVDNDRPSNPLANILDEEQSQSQDQNTEEMKQISSYSRRSDVNTDEKENLSNVEKLSQKAVIDRKSASLQTIDDRADASTASEIKNYADKAVGNLKTRHPELNVYSATVATISPCQRLRKRVSSNRSVSVPVAKLSSKTKGPSCVEVSLENKRTVMKPQSMTICDALTLNKRSRRTAPVKDEDSDEETDNKEVELTEKRVTRRTTSEYMIARKKKSMHLDSFKPKVVIPAPEITDEDFLNVPKSRGSRRTTEKLEASTSKRAPETITPPVTPQKRKKIVKVSPANDSMFSSSNQSKLDRSIIESRLMDTTLERRNLRTKVVFTMLDSPQLTLIVRQCGGTVVDTVEASTVLVTTSIKRTQKLLTAVGLGKPICSVKWLEDSKIARHFLDPWDYILTDEEAERKWNFSLTESLNRSNQKKLLDEHVFQICVNTATDVLRAAIEACGGKCVSRAPAKSDKKFVVIASPDNRNKYKKFLQKIPPVPVVNPEAIFHGVLIQKFEVAPFLLS